MKRITAAELTSIVAPAAQLCGNVVEVVGVSSESERQAVAELIRHGVSVILVDPVEVSLGYDVVFINAASEVVGGRSPVSFSRDGGETWAVIGECDVKSIEWDIECPDGVYGGGRGGGGKKVLLAAGVMNLSLAASMPVLIESRLTADQPKGKGRKAHKKLNRKMGGGW